MAAPNDFINMANVAAAVQSGIQSAVAREAEVKTWWQKHERLIIIVLALAGVLFVTNKVLNHSADVDKQKSDIAAQTLSQQKETDKALAAQVAQTQAQYQQLVIQLSQQNAQLVAAVQTRTVVLQQQQAVDRTLPLPDLGKRWVDLVHLQPTDIQPTASGITVSTDGARTTVAQLEKVPVLEANVQDGQTQIANDEKQLTASNIVIASQSNEIDGLKLTVVDQDKSCKTQIATVKAEARKSKLKTFLYGAGVGAGLVIGVVLHAVL